MKLSKTEIAVLRVLMTSEDFHSSYEIASSAKISRRMVRTVMPGIRQILEQNGITLNSKSNKGYRLSLSDPKSRQVLLKLIESDEKVSETVPEGLISRHNYIMRRLIETQDYVKVDDFADEMLLSRSALSTLMKNIRGIIKKYELTLEQKPYYGVRIAGKEIEQRHALNDFSFTSFSDASMFYDWLDAVINDTKSWEYEIVAILKKYRIRFTDIALCDLLLGIGIQIERISQSHVLDDYLDCSELAETPEMKAAEEVAQLIEEQSICSMNRYEINALAASIACKRSLCHIHTAEPEAKKTADEILKAIREQTGMDYAASSEIDLFPICISQIMRQLKYGEKNRTEMWDTAFTQFPLSYHHAKIAAGKILQKTGKKLGVSQVVFLTEAFRIMNEAMNVKPLRTLFICGHTDIGDSVLRKRIADHFIDLLNIDRSIQYYQIYEIDLDEYDLILTTIDIHKQINVPHLRISSYVTREDLQSIETFLHTQFILCVPEKWLHPDLYHEAAEIENAQSALKLFEQDVLNVYGEVDNPASGQLSKQAQTEVINDTLWVEAVRDMRYASPWWIAGIRQPFEYEGSMIQRIIAFFGDRGDWEYQDMKRLLRQVFPGSDEPLSFTELIEKIHETEKSS